MSIIHVTGGGGSVGTERTPFTGHRLPDEIKHMLAAAQGYILNTMDKPTFRNFLTVAVDILEGKTVDPARIAALATLTLSAQQVSIIITGLHRLLQLAIRFASTSLKAEMLTEDLTELKLPKDYISDIVSAVYSQRRGASLQRYSVESGPRLPTVTALKWRVDVAISTSVLNRVLQPTVTMEMELSDGRRHNFEMPVSKFHELRYNAAFVLKDMEDLEKRSILKIQD